MLDDAPPPTKRLKLQKKPYSGSNKENHNPDYIPMGKKEDVRKRKVPVRKPTQPHISDLNAYVLLEVIDYLSLEDLCNLAETSRRMRQLARLSFQFRTSHADIRLTNASDMVLLGRLWGNFGDMIASVNISIRH
ncbi:uncharacterized protein LOC129568731 [Sitodiplosis mosellana]|uniref:uncharacterized protein LOC129568731 n=1 Tax=Sitodiplosis mosellana TaxID=263140 RepID=UPI0024452AD1|nr:uncharacterized protein LOC129568731 [Sitodiplosis mosellana]